MDTKEAIKSKFMEEYVTKDFSGITVKGLCAATPVARTTFYSHYSNTDDVRCEVEDELIEGLIRISEEVSAGNYPDMDAALFMDETEAYIKANWTYIYAFLVQQPNLRFMRKWKDAIKANFGRRYPDKQRNRDYDTIAEIVASSMLSAYTYWMEHPDTTDTKDIKPLIQKVLDTLVTNL